MGYIIFLILIAIILIYVSCKIFKNNVILIIGLALLIAAIISILYLFFEDSIINYFKNLISDFFDKLIPIP